VITLTATLDIDATAKPDLDTAPDRTAVKARRRLLLLSALIYTGVVVVDLLIATLVALVIIPTLGARLFNSAVGPSMSLNGEIVFWLAPFVSLIALLVVGELVAMRGLWRLTRRQIARIARRQAASASR